MRLQKFLIILWLALLVFSCTEREEALLPPQIKLDSSTGIYTVKEGCELTIVPEYTNVGADALYSWKCGDEVISTSATLSFKRDAPGQYYILLEVSTAGGQAREELRIDVMSLTPPQVHLPGAEEGFTILQGSELDLRPVVTGDRSMVTTYLWQVDGEEVSRERDYTFVGSAIGAYALTFTAENEDGAAVLEFAVRVVDAQEVDFAWSFEKTEYNVAKGRRILLRPLDVQNAFDAVYTWTVAEETVQEGPEAGYVFEALQEGVYEVKVSMRNEYLVTSQRLVVNVCPEEGTYYRTGGAGSSAASTAVFEFLPGPGQFVNGGYTATTMQQACEYAQQQLSRSGYVSLGGFGGYIVVGFDHSVDNDGEYNLAIRGNALETSSEPGIVWVMQDENGDGLPNDTWYELKGSEYGKAETVSDYAVTYYRPSAPGMPVSWTDNYGMSGTVDYLGAYHSQDYYYPDWVAEDSYTLRGTRLKERNYDQSGNGTYWVSPAYDWGYADNYSSVDREGSDNRFRLSDAVTFDGKEAGLKYIDFVKIQVGVNSKSGWLGEMSTEVLSVRDYNLEK